MLLGMVAERNYHEIRLCLVEVTAELPVRLLLMVITPNKEFSNGTCLVLIPSSLPMKDPGLLSWK